MPDTSGSRDIGGIGLLTVLIALIFLFVWPGPLRFDFKEAEGSKTGHEAAVVKIDHITQNVWDYNWEKHRWEKR
ncbi:MAG: hypothetical protein ACYC64_06265 [Armatimonadota bacterium]